MKKIFILAILLLSLSACDGASINEEEAKAVFRDAFSKFAQSESYSFDLSFSINQSTSYLEIDSTGSSDYSDPEKAQISYESIIKNSQSQGKELFTITLNIRQIADAIYLNLKEAAGLDPQLIDKWQLISGDNLQTFMGLGELGKQENIYKTPLSGDLNKEQRNQLSQYLQENDLVQIIRIYSDDILNGIPIYHISAEVDQEALKGYLLEAAKIQGKSISTEDLSEIEEVLSKLSAQLEAYIGREDHRLYKVTGNLSYKVAEQKTESIYRISLSNYGKKLDLQEPAEYQDFLKNEELESFEDDLEKLNSKECQEAMQKAQSLDSESDPSAIEKATENLRKACQ